MEQKSLINELMQGKDLAKQLIHHLQPCSSNEIRLFLIQKIISSYETSLSILNWGAFADDNKSHSRDGHRDDRKRKNEEIYKNIKIQPKWTEQVKDCSGTGIEGPSDDGYCWRKYGQKVILGANFPRCYYRCTHRHARGCLAKKQVQRSSADQTIFQITYKGRHTCTQDSQSLNHQNIPNKLDEIRFDFNHDIKVKIEGLETGKDEISTSILFSNGKESAEENFLTDLLNENSFMVSLSPPPGSESNYFSAFQLDSFGSRESELTQNISLASPFEDCNFASNFQRETPELFDSSSHNDALAASSVYKKESSIWRQILNEFE